jgi:glycosyltransferase involved in cell wall biosynthesis
MQDGPDAVLHLDTGRLLRGGQRQVLMLMRALRERGWTNVLAAPPGAALAEAARAEGFAAFAFAPRGDLDLLAAWRLGRRAADEGLALWHAHSARAQAVASLALGWPPARRRRLVVTRRTAFARRGGLSHRLKYGDPRIACYLAISEAVAAGLRARGVRQSRIHLVPSAVDPAPLAAAARAQLGEAVPLPPGYDPTLREAQRLALGLPADAFLVGAAGALDRSKGHDILLRAASIACVQAPRLHVLIAGEGPEGERLAEEARLLGMGEHFHLLGRRRDLPRLFAALDLFCMPSREEGLGSVVLEAFAAGVPVLASDAGGLAELLHPGVTGRLAPRANPEALAAELLAALHQPEDGRRMALSAYDCAVRQFCVERMSAAVERVYRSLAIAGGRRGTRMAEPT